jgi:MFS family permease
MFLVSCETIPRLSILNRTKWNRIQAWCRSDGILIQFSPRDYMKKTKSNGPRLYYGWVIVGVLALAGFTQTSQTFPVWGVLLKPITEEMGWSRTAFSGAMGVGTVLGAFVGLAVAPFIDRVGPRWPMVGAFAVIGLSLVFMAGMDALWQFYLLLVLGRVLHLGVVSISTESTIPKWFMAKRGMAVGIGTSGNRIGSAITPVYVQALILLSSWRLSLVVIGIVVWVVSLVPVALFMRRGPEELGLQPDGAPAPPLRGPMPGIEPSGQSRMLNADGPAYSRAQVLRTRAFYMLMGADAVLMTVIPTTSLHLIPFFTDRGISPEFGVAVVALSSLIGVVGSLVAGWLRDRVGSQRVAMVSFLSFGGLFVLLPLVFSPTSALLWGLGYGLIQGAIIISVQVLIADYFGPRHLAAIRGMVMPVRSVGQAAGPVLAGIAFDTTGGYGAVFAAFVVLNLCAAGLIFFAKQPVVPPLPLPAIDPQP